MEKEKIIIVTDAWFPQVNGVYTTLKNVVFELRKTNDVLVVHPDMFSGIKIPFYKEIKMALPFGFSKIIKKYNPDYIHIATEGPLGIAAKLYCKLHGLKHNTSFHTNFPMLLQKYLKLPPSITWWGLRHFHWDSKRILVTNEDMKNVLINKGFRNEIVVWNRGIDHNIFNYSKKKDTKEPVLLCVSRISKEKNLEQFCELSDAYECILVGGGPYQKLLMKKYPNVTFVGNVNNYELPQWYKKADVFFFPSKFDTFGIVMLESMACGTPVIGFNVIGPKSLINKDNGVLIDSYDEIYNAIHKCLSLNRKKVSESVEEYTWEHVAKVFKKNLVLSR